MNKAQKPIIRRIYQVLPSFSQHDAIGNDAVLIDKFLKEDGIESDIFYSERGDGPLARPISKMVDEWMNETLILYHFSVASTVAHYLAGLPSKIWARYHNITPPKFFNQGAEGAARETCRVGRSQIPFVAAISDVVIADSSYNGEELAPFTRSPIYTQPIFRDYGALASLPEDRVFAEKLRSIAEPKILFVGRVAPNKCQHDLVQLAYLYRKAVGKRIKVILAGSFFSSDYKKAIEGFAKDLGLTLSKGFDENADVMVLGMVSDEQLASLYRHSDLYVSMSEHEGFGVPLVESLWFDLPVVAHDACAVAETLGDAGTLVNKKDWVGVLEAVHDKLEATTPSADLTQAHRRRDELSMEASFKNLKSLLSSHLTLDPRQEHSSR